MTFHPNSEQVTVAWLGGIFDASIVGTDLSTADNLSLATSGFVQVRATGGSPNIDVPQRLPNVQLDFWARAADSGRPPWNRAWSLANTAYAAVLDHPNVPRAVTLSAAYNGARVQSVWPLTEPRVLPGDQGSYARVSMDLTVAWTEI